MLVTILCREMTILTFPCFWSCATVSSCKNGPSTALFLINSLFFLSISLHPSQLRDCFQLFLWDFLNMHRVGTTSLFYHSRQILAFCLLYLTPSNFAWKHFFSMNFIAPFDHCRFHQVDSEDLTIAVNFWWRSNLMSGMSEHMDAYYLRLLLRR